MISNGFVTVVFFAIFLITGAFGKPVDVGADSLYDAHDNVTELDGQTFKSTVFNSPHIWMVEFYSSWCGHCQQFAPIFKAFAKDIADWCGVYRLAVINCPDTPNREICSAMNVGGYPEMRVFPPFSTPDTEVMHIEGMNVQDLRNSSVKIIEKYIGDIGWSMSGISRPTFQPISYDEARSFHKSDETSFYLALVVGDDPFDIGKQIILDMSSCANITVRIFDNNFVEIEKLRKFTSISFHDLPTVVVLSKDGTSKEIEVNFKRRHFYTYKLQRLPGVGETKLIPKLSSSSPHVGHRNADIDWIEIDRSKVYMADLESGLQYALTVEVASSKTLEGATLDALQKFVGTLAEVSEYLPVSDTTKTFLLKLTGWLAGQSKIIRDDWLKRIQTKEATSYLPQLDQRWVGCAPSKPGLRGYPCSLWTIFHSMSVAAYYSNIEDKLAVPHAIEAYITTFFSCKECRKNFVKELTKHPYKDNVLTHPDAILWLWDLHNDVNDRLHGEVSEDPNIPKVQYPTRDSCRECRKEDGSWNRPNVIGHLIRRYSISAVSTDFMQVKDSPGVPKEDVDDDGMDRISNFLKDSMKIEETLLADLEARNLAEDGKEINELDRHGNSKILQEPLKNRRKHNSLHLIRAIEGKKASQHLKRQSQLWRSPPLLSNFDTSFCVLLWGTSLTAVVMMYLYLKRRKVYKKC